MNTADARRLHALGVTATASGRPVDGARILRDALRMVAGGGQRELEGRILLSLAFAEAEQGRVAKGLRLFDEAAALLDDQAMVDAQRGAMLARNGRPADAIPYLDRAVEAFGAAGDPVELSRALLNRAYARMNAGQLRQNRPDLLRCIRLAREHGLHSIAIKAVENLGYLDFFAGNVPRALRQLDDAARECARYLPSYLPVIAADKARVLLSVGLTDDANRELDVAIAAFRRRRLSQVHAEAELARAEAELLAGRPEAARRSASAARRRFLRRANQTWAELASLVRLRAAFLGGSPPLALGRRGQLIAGSLGRLGLVDDARSATLLSVRAYLRAGRLALATEAIGSIRAPRAGDPLDLRLSWHLTRAELAAAGGDGGRQSRHLRAGLRSLHQHRSLLGSIDLQTGIAAHGRELAAAGLATALATGRPAAVFEWAELARAQAFRVAVATPRDPGTASALEELRQVLFVLREAELRREPTGRLRERRTELERAIRERAWHESGPGASSPVVRLEAVRSRLALHGDAMVVYLHSAQRIVALVLTARSATLVDLAEYRSVDNQLRRLRADLDTLAVGAVPLRMADVLRQSRQREAQRLCDLLIRPVLSLVGDRRLVVVPTGVLFGVPWPQLDPLRGRPVVVSPSATAWVAAGDRAPPPSPGPALLMAGPGLANSVREVRSIASIVPGSVCLTGADATPAAAINLLDGARLAHIAAHGHHERENSLFSSIDLVSGPLMGYDLQRLRRPPQRVVLSTCELGLSSVRAGDEILGMVAALLAAGSTTVIASVSRPVDGTVPEVMIPFHRMLAGGAGPAEALARATADQHQASFVCFGTG